MAKRVHTKKAIETIEIDDNGDEEITRGATGNELAIVQSTQALNGILDREHFNLLMEPPPPHAIRKRPDGYDYLSHGYVTLTLNNIFGSDWDHELLPVFGGNYYQFIPADETKTGKDEVIVYGKLTVRIHEIGQDGLPRRLLATIVKTGFGSAQVRNKQERGDAIKGAQSDSRKVCAAQLGPRLGLTLYWDDEAKVAEYEEAKAKREAEVADKENESLTDEQQALVTRMKAERKKPKEIAEAVGRTVGELSEMGVL